VNSTGDEIYNIVKIDLSNNSSELFLTKIKGVVNIFCDQWQKWLFIEFKESLEVYDIADKLLIKTLFSNKGSFAGIDGILYSPQKNKLLITWLNRHGQELISNTAIYNAPTLEKVDSTAFAVSFNSILSLDGDNIYQYGVDSVGSRFVNRFSISANKLLSKVPFSNIVPTMKYKIIEDGKNGMVLISFNSSIPSNNGKNYIVYNLETGESTPPISFPYRTYGYLTPNDRYVILQKVLWDPEKATAEDITGEISIYKTSNGELVSNLTLPPEGKILIFNNFPNMFYYYDFIKDTTIPVDLTKLQNEKGNN